MAQTWSHTLEQAYTFDWQHEHDLLNHKDVKHEEITAQVDTEVQKTYKAGRVPLRCEQGATTSTS